MLVSTPCVRMPQGRLVYLRSDLSFDTVGRQESGVASVLVNDIHVEFSDMNEATAVWGLCPHLSWQQDTVNPPVNVLGKLQYKGELTPGVSIRANPSGENWTVRFDPHSGWLNIGASVVEDGEALQFLKGCVALLKNGKIIGLYLRPIFE